MIPNPTPAGGRAAPARPSGIRRLRTDACGIPPSLSVIKSPPSARKESGMPANTLDLVTELTLRRATPADLQGVLALLARTAGWLNGLGVRQWPTAGFPAERIEPLIGEGVMYLLDAGDEAGRGRPPRSPWTATPTRSSGPPPTAPGTRSTSTSSP
ncbi:hypothetical protein GCM10027612_31700 [Microbispora bryophytorum subsp. camponoti]